MRPVQVDADRRQQIGRDLEAQSHATARKCSASIDVQGRVGGTSFQDGAHHSRSTTRCLFQFAPLP